MEHSNGSIFKDGETGLSGLMGLERLDKKGKRPLTHVEGAQGGFLGEERALKGSGELGGAWWGLVGKGAAYKVSGKSRFNTRTFSRSNSACVLCA